MSQNHARASINFFLYVNAKSGDRLGKNYLSISNQQLMYEYKDDLMVKVKLINMTHVQKREQSFCQIKDLILKQQKVRIIICGGDGTITWLIGLVVESGIDLERVAFCILPIGTGNDFSRALGWGGYYIYFKEGYLIELKQRIIEWIEAEEAYYDLWNITFTTYPDGTVYKIRDHEQIEEPVKVYSRQFCNYTGFGIDARVTYSFEKYRQPNRCGNYCCYTWMGIVKLMKYIRTTYEAIRYFGQDEYVDEQDLQSKKSKKLKSEFGDQRTLEQRLLRQQRMKKSQVLLKDGYCGLVCLNSTSYMVSFNAWNTTQIAIEENLERPFLPQRVDDGMVQFLTYKNQWTLGFQKFMNTGYRVAQGKGPYKIIISRDHTNTPSYIQIDGEALKILHLKDIVIRKSTLVPNGHIRVLINKAS